VMPNAIQPLAGSVTVMPLLAPPSTHELLTTASPSARLNRCLTLNQTLHPVRSKGLPVSSTSGRFQARLCPGVFVCFALARGWEPDGSLGTTMTVADLLSTS